MNHGISALVNDTNQVYSYYKDTWVDQNNLHVWIYQHASNESDTAKKELEERWYKKRTPGPWLKKYMKDCDPLISEDLKKTFKKEKESVSIFGFDDLTIFLEAVYKKRYIPNKFSYRTLSTKYSINISMLHGIFKGKKKISQRYGKTFTDLLKLRGKEKRYFELLMHVSQSGMPHKLQVKIMDQFNKENI